MAQPILEVKNLTKTFNSFTAVDGISFSVAKGEVLGLLGPNGAGKTTTIQMLLGLITPTSGSISYFSRDFTKDPEYCLSRINYASANAHINAKLTVWQNLTIFAGLYGISKPEKRILEMLELLEVAELKNELFWHLSSGQKTRVMIAKSLLNKPQLILMDEPTAFLDVEIATKVTDLVIELQKRENVSILFTSHRMDEVEKVCDRVIFLSHGKVVAEDTPMGLAKRAKHATLLLMYEGERKKVVDYLKKKKLKYVFPRAQRVEVMLSEEYIPEVLFGLSHANVRINEIDIQKPSLEDAFLDLIQKETV